MQLACISLTLFRQSYLSSIALSRSFRLHPVSIKSCCIGRPILARPCEGVHRRRSRMISFLLLQQCSACLISIVLEIGGRWSNNCCFVGCCFQDFFYTARKILVLLLSSFFSIRFMWYIQSLELTQLLLGRNYVSSYRIG